MLTGPAAPRRLVVVGSVCLAGFLWISWCSHQGRAPRLPFFVSPPPPEEHGIANATLGFGAIWATSMEDQNDPFAWRQKGMMAAANRTGLEIQIPPPPPAISDEDLERLMTVGNGPYPKAGSARAYWSHIKAMENFLASGMETMLLLEDDADWELDIRKILAPGSPVSEGIRSRTGATEASAQYPYGKEWDLLWLGHCGFETLDKPPNKIAVKDDQRLPAKQIKPVIGHNLYKKMANETREVHAHIAAMCTFGIGITRPWAEKILAGAFQGGTQGVDFSTHVACKYGDMRCVGVLPELLHHQRAAGGGYRTAIQIANDKDYAGKKDAPRPNGLKKGAVEDPNDPVHFFTMNLRYSARCNAFSSDADRKMCLPTDKDKKTYDT